MGEDVVLRLSLIPIRGLLDSLVLYLDYTELDVIESSNSLATLG